MRFYQSKSDSAAGSLFFSSLLSIVLFVIQQDTTVSLSGVLNMLFEMFLGHRNHLVAYQLWFFTCIFVVSVLYRWLIFIFKSPRLLLLLLTPLNLWQTELLNYLRIEPLSLPFNMDSAMAYIAYFCAGQCLFPFLKALYEQRKKHLVLITILMIVSASTTIGVFYGGSFTWIVMEKLGMARYLGRCAYFIQAVILILFITYLSMLFSNIKLLFQMGKCSLTLCATELITKNLLATVLQIFSVNVYVTLTTPLVTLIYTFICCMTSYYVFAKWIPQKLPKSAILFGRNQVN